MIQLRAKHGCFAAMTLVLNGSKEKAALEKGHCPMAAVRWIHDFSL
jgi:hypothetical protein